MHRFQVWAPKARTMEVKIGDNRFPMERGERGWWAGEVSTAAPGTDYGFVVDGEEPALPDPRSAWQPNGVHGASRVLDHAAFVWSDTQWQPPPLSGAILYELHIGVFTPEGTLEAAERHLDHLKDLGITHIELMPVATFSGRRGWGYDGVNLYAPHPVYGGPDALKHFVNACHGKGLAVLLDVVYNHLGPVGNYLSRFGPYFTGCHSTPWGDAVNLEEAESNEVRRFFIDNALMWLRDYHLDGLRLDAVQAFVDRSAIHFLEQLAEEVRALESRLEKHFVVIAESDLNDPRIVNVKQTGGFGLDAQWSDDFHHALFSAITGIRQGYYADFGSLAALAKSLEKVFVYDGAYSVYRRRNHGRPVVGLSGHRFVSCVQNHDQVGNLVRGERITQLTSLGRVKIAAALLLTSPYVPLLFQGEEFGASSPFQYFTDYEDGEIGRLVTEGRRKEFEPFGWSPEEIPDPQDEETFTRCKLIWSEVDQQPHACLLQWYKDMIRLRRGLSELADGNLDAVRVRFDEETKWLVMHRGRIVFACNLGKAQVGIDIGESPEVLLASDSSVEVRGDKIELGPDSGAVCRISARE